MIGSNPFATRFTRPGLLPALDAAGRPLGMAGLVRRLARCRQAAIVGPHGSGKSTVLAHLLAELRRQGVVVRWMRLRSFRDLPTLLVAMASSGQETTLGVDSWECLGPMAGWLVRGLALVRGCRLVVTSHRAGAFPVLVECRPSPAVLESLVCRLPAADGWLGRIIQSADLESAFALHGGDIREALFDLYDRFEARRPRRSRSGYAGRDRRSECAVSETGIHESDDDFFQACMQVRNLG